MAEKPTYEELEQRVQELETDYSQLEKKLQEAHFFSEEIMRYMTEGLVLTDTRETVIFINQRLSQMLGYLPEQIIGKCWRDMVLGEHQAIAQEAETRRSQGHTDRYEIMLRHKDGHKFPVLIGAGPRFDKQSGEFIGTMGVVTDITDRKQAEDALNRKHTMLARTEAMAKVGSWEWEVEGDKVTWSEELFRIFGFEPKEDAPPFKEHQAFYIPEDRVRLERKQAEEDRKKLQDQLSQAQKAESLGRMSGAVAHHFNNQLSVVMGNLELILLDLPDDTENQKSLLQAMKAVQKAADVSWQILNYLGPISGTHTAINLSEVCRQSLSLLQSAVPKSMTVNVDFPDSGPLVHADVDQVQQVLTNLFTNAQESISDNQGSIDLNIQTVSHADIPASNRFPLDWQSQDIPYACLEISDAGGGIIKEDIEKIFDPFFTTKFTGRGMGLSVIIGILKTHSGCITVDSEAGHGSVFRIYLPVSSGPSCRRH